MFDVVPYNKYTNNRIDVNPNKTRPSAKESLVSWDLRDLNPEPAGYESAASGKVTDSNVSVKTAHERHIRIPLFYRQKFYKIIAKNTKTMYIDNMFEVVFTKAAKKGIRNLSEIDRKRLNRLVDSLKKTGPMQPAFRNFSKLGENTFHCHLSYSWVACWSQENEKVIIEVYYVGSREKAPY